MNHGPVISSAASHHQHEKMVSPMSSEIMNHSQIKKIQQIKPYWIMGRNFTELCHELDYHIANS